MTATTDKVKGSVRIYAAGGGGTNIAGRLEWLRTIPSPGFADFNTVYIDTSKSNLSESIPSDAIYLFEGLDGAGQVRREHAGTVKERVKEILHNHKPNDLNIVLHSASGGSGSVIGPLLATELLARDLPTVVIMVGDASTRLYAENTLNTFKSYEHIALNTLKVPVVIAYFENTAETPRGEVDERIERMVLGLTALFSRQNAELDSRDLYNWLRFDKVTTFKQPMLASLSVIKSGDDISHMGNVVSVATLAKSGVEASFPVMPEVRFLGLLPSDMNSEVMVHSPIHFVTSDGLIHEAVLDLNSVLSNLTEVQQSRVGRKSILTTADRPIDDTGLIL